MREGALRVPLRDASSARRPKARTATRFRACVVALAGLLVACARPTSSTSEPQRARGKAVRAALRQLRSHEMELRRAALESPTVSKALGVDPFRLCALPQHLVGLLRGSSELVLLDTSLREQARVAGPKRPVACASLDNERVAVVGAERAVYVYRAHARGLELESTVSLPTAISLRALAANERALYVADESKGTLHIVPRNGRSAVRELALCKRPSALVLTSSNLIVNCLYEHALSVRPLDVQGIPGAESVRLNNDGPFWAISALESKDGLLVAASGVEDHPLQRFEGAFGYVDSFAYLFRVRGATSERLWAENVSSHGLLVPKAVELTRARSGKLSLMVSSGGSDRLARFEFDESFGASTELGAFVPGVSDWARVGDRLFAASPLLDVWASVSDVSNATEAPQIEKPRSALPEPSSALRLGEALAFTSLIAPGASSEGRKSRFTCETCHFEGGVDARIHHTGRGDVHVVTRPLLGLLRNAPHFSRALDPDLTSVSHNEFRVAGLGNADDPWFALRVSEFPWLRQIGITSDVEPQALRTALVDFLARFEPNENARTRGRSAFSDAERRGAESFREHCERCHAARLASDDASTHVDFARWESLVFDGMGALVWARGDYELTDVLPYVNEKGTRIAALRRVVDKYPYFTNGSARSLADVVARSRESAGHFSHASVSSLGADEQAALVAFLELL